MKRIFLCILVLSSLNLQAKDFTFERLNSYNGLSQNNVLTIHKDSEGYIWFGTYDGLNRYDGYDFEVFRKTDEENSLTSNFVGSIAEDTLGNMWIGSFSNGFCKYDKNSNTFTRFLNTEENPDLITSNVCGRIFVDSKNRIWTSSNPGINILTLQPDGNYSIQKIQNDPNDPFSLFDNSITTIIEDKNGRIFLCNNNSIDLMIFDEDGLPQNKFHHLYWGEIKGFNGIIETTEGYVVTTSLGAGIVQLNEDNPEKSKLIQLENHNALNIVKDSEGNIFTSGSEGLHYFVHTPGEDIPYKLVDNIGESEEITGLSNQFIRSMYYDNTGILWLGTNGAGICKYNSNKIRFKHYKNTKQPGSLGHKKVWDFYEHDNYDLYVSTEGDGVNFHPASMQGKYETGFQSIRVNSEGQQNFAFKVINVSNNDLKLWVGVGYNNKLVEITQPENTEKVATQILPEVPEQIMALYKDEFDNIWLSIYNGGLGKVIPEGDGYRLLIYNVTNSTIPTNIIRNVFEDSKGRLWIGTDKGLMLLTREQKNNESLEYKLFISDKNDSSSLNNSYIVPITETSNGEIWIGTFGGGLNQYHEGSTLTNGKFSQITIEDGLPNNTIKQIIEDDFGYLWVTSNYGMSRIDPTRTKIRNFEISDGLQDMEFVDLSGTKLHDGRILVGGVNGFNAFYPQDIKEDTTPPIIVLNNLFIENKSIQIGEEINGRILLNQSLNNTSELVLDYTENTFNITFSALHYFAPESNRFKYMLEGIDKDWISATSNSRSARYANINPGKYTFKIMASNCYSVWTEKPRVLSIVIIPPYWQTWWFRIFVTLLFGGIILFAYRRRMSKIKREQADLQRRIDESMVEINKSKEEMEKAKTEIEEHKEQIRLKDLEESSMRYFNKGLAIFSEIIGQHNELGKLCHAIILELVKYVDAQLGVIYVITDDEEDSVLKIQGSYGSNIGEHDNISIMKGEGNVGTCFSGGEIIELDNVKDSYIKVSSGLGESFPKHVCLVPLIQNENKSGVIEIASFNKIESFKIDFIKKLGENITASIFLMRAMDRNEAIIAETQSQSEELKAQEEEMRQNIEELMATQEENDRIKADTEEKFKKLEEQIALKEKENKKLKAELKKLNKK